jgi:hypothetical protein
MDEYQMKETFSVQHVVSNMQRNVDQDRIKYMVRDSIARQLAQHIADCTIKEEVGDFSTTYSCRVIVADVDHFYRLVERAALDISRRMSPLQIGETK